MWLLIPAKTIDSETQIENASLSFDQTTTSADADLPFAGFERDISKYFAGCSEDDPAKKTVGLWPAGDPLVAILKTGLEEELIPETKFTLKEFAQDDPITPHAGSSEYEYD